MPFLMDSAFDGQYANIPEHMREALRRYVEDGIQPGSFLTAIIRNDLCEAVNRADDTNLPLIKLYVQWFYNEAPGTCWHNRENMTEWMRARAAEKKRTEELV